MITRRAGLSGLGAAATAVAGLSAPRPARAAWPAERPIEVIVPVPPGGGLDTMTRVAAAAAQRHLPGARFVVVNRPGAGGQIGWEAAYAAAPDGHTLAASSVPAMVSYAIERSTRYRADGFTYIANVVDDPGGLFVAEGSPLRGLEDLLAAARARPGAVTYGSTGVGSDDHFLVIALEEGAGLRPMNHVPFNGTAPMLAALLGGHLEVGAFNVSEGLALMREGKVRALGQAAAARWAAAPGVPTFREQGLDVVVGASRGIVAPPGLPAEIRRRLEAAFGAALADPDFLREAERLGLPLAPQIGEDFRRAVLTEDRELRDLWRRRPWRE
jgi:tripartite-type tricarboxylate transporter receptor subunit TctC